MGSIPVGSTKNAVFLGGLFVSPQGNLNCYSQHFMAFIFVSCDSKFAQPSNVVANATSVCEYSRRKYHSDKLSVDVSYHFMSIKFISTQLI